MWGIAKSTGRPLHPSIEHVIDMPYTVAHLIALRMRYDSYQELPEELPQEHWDFPHLVRRHLDKVFPKNKDQEIDSPFNYEMEVN